MKASKPLVGGRRPANNEMSGLPARRPRRANWANVPRTGRGTVLASSERSILQDQHFSCS